MKEKILAMLKTKYKHLGLSAKILELKAAQLAKKVEKEEDIETAVDGVDEELQMIQSLSDSHRTEIANLRKELKPEAKGADEEKKEPPANPDPQKTETKVENPELKVVLEAVTKIAQEVISLKAERTGSTRKQVFESKLGEVKGLPEVIKESYLELFEAKQFADDDDFNAFVEAKLNKAGEIAQQTTDDGLGGMPAPVNGNSTVKTGLSEKELDTIGDLLM